MTKVKIEKKAEKGKADKVKSETNTLKIGIAFGSGGAKGLSHIGVLRVLDKYGIKLDLIAGTSMGAIVGGIYALGIDTQEIERRMREFFSNNTIFSSRNFHFFHESLIRQDDIADVFNGVIGDAKFEDTKIDFMALALDLESGLEHRMTTGKMAKAMEAASAIPALFPPVYMDTKYLVDGGLMNATPVDYLREKKMDIVIGVHTKSVTAKQYISAMVWEKFYKKPAGMKTKKRGMLEQAKINMTLLVHILMRTIEVARKLNSKISFLTAHPDVVITPETEGMGLLEFNKIDEAIKAGEVAMEEQMPKLLEVIARKQAELKAKK
ncbi:patatin-like phospholipase family protein [Patescibacteria group bacterium]|nr:patatin-like phospholipase family protein [Patescibacteria group bacterium]